MTIFESNFKRIAYIGNLIHQTLNLPTYVLHSKSGVLFQSNEVPPHLIDCLTLNNELILPKIKFNSLNEIFIIVNAVDAHVIVGPFSYTQLSLNQLIHQAMLIHFLIHQQPIQFEDVLKQNFYNEKMIERLDEKMQRDFTSIRIDDYVKEPFVPFHYERELISYIKHGNTKELIKMIDKITLPGSEVNHLNEDPIQSMKTLLTTLLILSTRAAITGGLIPAVAYKLNTYYLNQIQKISDLQALNELKMTCLMDLATRVEEINTAETSYAVSATIFYITKNLYQSLSLTMICADLHFNPSYLSRLFKKEMNITISEFILNEKIEEAKRLLLISNHSILEISILLHFTDQSYFTKCFKKVTQMTPKAYRNQYKIIS